MVTEYVYICKYHYIMTLYPDDDEGEDDDNHNRRPCPSSNGSNVLIQTGKNGCSKNGPATDVSFPTR